MSEIDSRYWGIEMNWKDSYQQKLMSANEAIRLIHDGDRISFANGMGDAPAIIDALETNYQQFHDVEIVFMQGIGELPLPGR